MTRAAVGCLLLALAACDSGTGPGAELRLQIVSGDQQTAGAGARLPQPVVVRVVDDDGQPVRGARVSWRTLEGGGSVSETHTTSDETGQASVAWTLGRDVGAQVLLASAGTATLTVRATSRFEIRAVAAGFRHSCAITSLGTAYCWGANPQGQLGDGSEVASATPVRVSGQERFEMITAGWSHTCALATVGAAYCWGDNSVGQAGLASGAPRSAVPAAVSGTDAFSAISAGFVHTCAVAANGDAVCWGANDQGQLGGAAAPRVRIGGLQLRAIAAGEFHSCAIGGSGQALCWGWNSSGELGSGSAPGVIRAAPAPVAGTTTFTAIAAGVRHSCALATGGQPYCWGRNAAGETGQDPFIAAAVPMPVNTSLGFSAIGTGNTHTCGLANQRAHCWGSPIANGSVSATRFPVAVSGDLAFTSLAVGYAHTCGVSNGEVWCWGSNSHGQLGRAGIAESAAPLRVAFPSF